MKAAILAFALFATCAVSVHGQALAPAPAPCLTVAQLAQQAGLNSLLQAVDLVGLTSTLSDPTLAATVFAPTDAAFSALLQEFSLNGLQDLVQSNELAPVLEYHVLGAPLLAADLLSDGSEPTSYLNETLLFAPVGATVGITAFYNNATVTSADNIACQSVVHVIDNVLVPQFFLPDAPATAPVAQAI